MTRVRISNPTTPSSSCGPRTNTSHPRRAGTRRSAVARPAAASCAPLSWRVRAARSPLSSPYRSCGARRRTPLLGRSPSLRLPRPAPRPGRPRPSPPLSLSPRAPTSAPPLRRPGRPARRQPPPRPQPSPRPPLRSAGLCRPPRARARRHRRPTRRAPEPRRPLRRDLLPRRKAHAAPPRTRCPTRRSGRGDRALRRNRQAAAFGRGAADRFCLTYRLVSSARISGRPVSMPCRARAATSAAATF